MPPSDRKFYKVDHSTVFLGVGDEAISIFHRQSYEDTEVCYQFGCNSNEAVTM